MLFLAAWALVVGGVLSAAAQFRVGFFFFALAGLILVFLGGSLALNAGQLSDRMVEEVVSRWSLQTQPLSVTRFGGGVMLAAGAVFMAIGFIAGVGWSGHY